MPATSPTASTPSTSLELAHQDILALIHTFEHNQTHYLTSTYSEAALRQDFLDRLFIALGWDVTHNTQTNPAEQEVKIERGVSVGAARKRADYAFYLKPNYRDVRFYVEAKKPSVDLDANADAHFQTLRYGWNSNTPLAVLTDFEQFHILDCRAIPDIGTALKRIHKKFRYTDFKDKEKFAEVYWLFSREALETGAHDRYVAALPKPKAAGKQMGLLRTGVQRVDESFLAELEQHRETLAKSFKRDNPELDGFELTEVTQRVLDRLVFLRFLEDKLIENEISVNEIANSSAPWAAFVKESRRLDARYNGVVYKPHPLIDSPSKFTADDADFKSVCDALSDKHSPFNFDVIPIHILGSIYERFLGKVITTTDKRAKVEEKPEVRKAGGVYYTPEYIVRYIVDQTVGVQIEGKTPEQIAKLRFADIACGSGSFLLSVFDVLLRYHTRWFNQHPERAEKAGCAKTDEAGDGRIAWRLSLKQRQSILLNNVFGVDVDQQAVEVSQVSLYLKLLEDETTSSSNQYALAFKEALLPALGKNVVCGNSLIGTDILDGQMFPREEERALNAMDFDAAFPAVMRQGGFDAVVGNPPYGAELSPTAKAYIAKDFQLGSTDTAALMMIRAKRLSKSNSRIGMIVPKPLTYSSTWEKTRAQLLTRLIELIDVGKVWKEVKLEQVICFFANETDSYRSLQRKEEAFSLVAIVPKPEATQFGFWINGLLPTEIQIGQKVVSAGRPFSEFANNTRGGMFQNLVSESKNDLAVIGGKQIERLFLREPKGYISKKSELPENALVKTGSILVQNIVAHIANPTDHIKIIGAVVKSEDANRIVILDTVNQLTNISKLSSNYLMALLHSQLINWFVYRFVYAKAIRTMHFDATSTDRIPIRPINFADPTDKATHDKLVQLVDDMLKAKQALAAARSESDTAYYTRRCAQLDQHIDALVYKLYGLTEQEIALVEGRADEPEL